MHFPAIRNIFLPPNDGCLSRLPTPVAYTPAAYTPVTYTPVAYTPVTYTPVAYTLVAYTPAAYTPVTYTPVAYTPVTYIPVAYTLVAYRAINYELTSDFCFRIRLLCNNYLDLTITGLVCSTLLEFFAFVEPGCQLEIERAEYS